MMYRVANPSELLVITGICINDIKIAKQAFVPWPLQKCRVFDLTPVNYTLHLNAMSIEKLAFLLPAVFTIGPRTDDNESLKNYAKLLSHNDCDSSLVKDLVQGIIEGETRVIAASMTMEAIFKDNKEFKQEVFEKVQRELNHFGLFIYNSNIKQLVDVSGHQYFSYLGQKIQVEAKNQAKIDVAEATMKGKIGAKERDGQTVQTAAKIDAETKIIATQWAGEGQKEEIKVKAGVKIFEYQREADVSKAEAEFTTGKAGWIQQASVAEVESAKAVAIREAELQREVERMNALTRIENLKAEFLSEARVNYDIKVQEANLDFYKKQKAAEAFLYEKEKAAEAERVAAEAQQYARVKAADVELYAKKKEAEGLIALAQAHGFYIRTLLAALGGDYRAFRDYLIINSRIFQDIARINAEAVKGLQPKISVWTKGSGTGISMKEV